MRRDGGWMEGSEGRRRRMREVGKRGKEVRG
jgi:hypothetical protein